MLAEICNILELTTIIICNFLVKKYVFLEPELEAKKQRIYYLLTAAAVAVSYIIWGNDIAIMVSLFAVGVNIFLSRKTHRIWGVFLMIPIPGIINGILVPTIVVPPYVCSMSERGGQCYELIVYAILSVLFLMFCIKGKNWRMWFRENMYNRSLTKWEKILLYITGCLMLVFIILNKPGKLTADEFEIMKSHTTAGRDLLRRAKEELGEIEYLNLALDMAAYHHEWWNGSGYPEGRSGEEIPVCARIMAVADVFDALTSKRCYKSAMPLEKAYGIIREESGTHFDERVVDVFFAVTDKIETVLEN
jgi:hypothetical protein